MLLKFVNEFPSKSGLPSPYFSLVFTKKLRRLKIGFNRSDSSVLVPVLEGDVVEKLLESAAVAAVAAVAVDSVAKEENDSVSFLIYFIWSRFKLFIRITLI